MAGDVQSVAAAVAAAAAAGAGTAEVPGSVVPL